ncbi:hypothetical protein BV898_15459 [Hypsibius exemplaris]|uniref:Uncharacterized protein n=1 Tax=Hypsibius exemplaris TaxID=2072580 RepID=A0A9X6RK77_HYPEX|nr:hypothetical protein BV898_15459 [Hypsibius exemplaris]
MAFSHITENIPFLEVILPIWIEGSLVAVEKNDKSEDDLSLQLAYRETLGSYHCCGRIRWRRSKNGVYRRRIYFSCFKQNETNIGNCAQTLRQSTARTRTHSKLSRSESAILRAGDCHGSSRAPGRRHGLAFIGDDERPGSCSDIDTSCNSSTSAHERVETPPPLIPAPSYRDIAEDRPRYAKDKT